MQCECPHRLYPLQSQDCISPFTAIPWWYDTGIMMFLAVLFLSLAITLNYLETPGSNIDQSSADDMTSEGKEDNNPSIDLEEENSNTQEDESNNENSTKQSEGN